VATERGRTKKFFHLSLLLLFLDPVSWINILDPQHCPNKLSLPFLKTCSIYPACLAPYLLVTATTDNTIRFWTAVDKSGGKHSDFAWEEWRMETEHGSSSIQVRAWDEDDNIFPNGTLPNFPPCFVETFRRT
jgi:hypothetical protein